MQVNNALDLNVQEATTPTPVTKSKVLARLEEVANDLIADGTHQPRDTSEKYTQGPMPPIQDANPTSIFDNINLPLIAEWDSHPGNKLLAIPFDTDTRSLDAHELICTKILTAVIKILETKGASVAALRPCKNATKRSRTPTSFIIYNISPEQEDLLLQRMVWSLKILTFRVTPFTTTCPNFLFAISNFSTTTLPDVYQMVRSVWDSKPTRVFVGGLLMGAPSDERIKTSLDIENLLKSMNLIRLDIKTIGNTLSPRYNVYADCGNFSNDRVWSALQVFLLNTEYTAPMQGCINTDKFPFHCSCCHGVDHPRGLCPFPSVPRWNGPKRERDPRNDRRSSGPFPDRRDQKQRLYPCT